MYCMCCGGASRRPSHPVPAGAARRVCDSVSAARALQEEITGSASGSSGLSLSCGLVELRKPPEPIIA